MTPAETRVAHALAAFAAAVQPRPALTLIAARTSGAPVVPGTPPTTAAPLGGTTAMTIIQRKAHDVRAGDVIVTDPDHPDRVVRWRVTKPVVRTGDDVTLIDYADLSPGGGEGLAVFKSLDIVSVEPAGVA